VSGTTKLTRY